MAKLLIAGQWVHGSSEQQMTHRYSGEALDKMAVASVEQVAAAVTAAQAAFDANALTPSDRYHILSRAAALVQERREQFMGLVSAETGFPRVDVENEVGRTVQTLQLCAEEARRVVGEMVPMDAAPGLKDRIGFTVMVPLGVVCAITPFNSPLNVVVHKVAPAVAAGNAVILKPSEHVPLTSVELCKVLIEAGLPPGLITLLHGGPQIGRALVADPRIAFYAFTGSTRVGKEIQAGAGLRRTQLELGSIASTIVCEDADLRAAVAKCVSAGFRKAGQVCTSVQRLYVQRGIASDFTKQLVAAVRSLPYGDPSKPETIVGPMLSVEHAQRALDWILEAQAAGAEVLCGGTRTGAVLAPTLLANVRDDMKVMCQEIFAPVMCLNEFDDLQQAYDAANATPFGLAAGLFTSNVGIALSAGRKLRFGAVHINEASSARVDVMPFGGVKDSGFGREGPRYAIKEMMEERLLTIRY
ncbi:aldehyde dehydrogenase family protein [Candidimonas nitroreducens]|uniref:Aldehyde dehydrogenase n=1 Tax=Candidimonas nitroreducens TaxID=683354 RepID=A0A225MX27_9BURK|nr:aldehyde dehydrogenase family protein [Candidimonas nitroreducens]OWT65785.1 aldehyde dehydrogenase [Candidimonas nitroreducens]